MPTKTSYRDLPVWQSAMRLAAALYQVASELPAQERVGLGADLQKAAVSLPTLIAVGSKRGRQGFREACLEGREKAAELETLLLLAGQLYQNIPIDDLLAEVAHIQATLTSMARRLSGLKETAAQLPGTPSKE